jgi:hypothetical protein
MDKDQVLSVKIFFINPLDFITVILNTLIELEYEAFAISDDDKEILPEILKENTRNVLFFCIRKKSEIEKWKEYVSLIKEKSNTHILLGAFVYNAMDNDSKMEFLAQNVSVIDFCDIETSPLDVMKRILFFFEARGKREFIRVKPGRMTEAYFTLKDDQIQSKVIDLSVRAFACTVPKMEIQNFKPGTRFMEVILVLKGIRIKTSAIVIGFSKDSPEIIVCKLQDVGMQNDKIVFLNNIPPETKRKIHEFIRKTLADGLNEKLSQYRIENKKTRKSDEPEGESENKENIKEAAAVKEIKEEATETRENNEDAGINATDKTPDGSDSTDQE